MEEFRHNTEQNRFELDAFEDTSIIEYRKQDGVYNLLHTRVPKPLEGRGVGMSLVAKTFEAIEQEGGKIIPSCAFIEAFLRRNPEWARIVAKA
jgi:uncharacterized protein